MLEALNHKWFLLINATPDSPLWALQLANFFAERLILVAPLLVAALWLWGPRHALKHQRTLAVKTAIAFIISMSLSWAIGHLFPHSRPFVDGFGYNFLHHGADNSFPSDHGTSSFTFAFAFLLWHRLWSGALLIIGAIAIAWSRIYLGVHWPLDMIGALFTALSGCLLTQLLWNRGGEQLLQGLNQLYRFCFALPIRKGWIRD
ncbi:undecaprenyl-diphosphatase [Salmonella enterica subsp. enterica serovar Choleraesuis]|nr:undecaprenyl-diphosphatase [Salmonella enterica subsp. enterica serovar Choleraesuis]